MGSDPSAGHPARSPHGRWRYRVVVGLIWFAVLAAAAAGWRYARTSGPAFGPVVVISIESLRADRLDIYGYSQVRTPAIDALAADSVSFDRAYAHSSSTLPAHVSLLSGLLPFQHGVRDEAGFTVPAGVSLLPQLLHRRGFKTGGVVSSYLLRGSTGLGPAFGFFDDELGSGKGGAANDRRDAAETVKVAERWIESVGSSRFFLFVHLDGPDPAAPLPERFARYSAYDARTAYADEQVGELVAFLKKRGMYNGGVVILTSDHGESFGEHGERGHGLFLYENAVRVPLVIKLPRRDGGGRHSSALVQHIDIAPTILDLIGAPRPSALRGRSLRNLLDSPTATIPDRQVYADAYAGRTLFGWSETVSLTDSRYRYIRSPRPELYDLLQDPKERVDISATEPARIEAMQAALDKLTSGSAPPAPAPAADPERERLRRLGFVAGMPAPSADAPAAESPAVKDRAVVWALYWQACSLSERGDSAGAIARLQEAVSGDPSAAAAWDRLSALLVESGRAREAAEALSSLLALYPDDARTAEAERRLRQILEAGPTAERYALAAKVWAGLGEKARVTEVRTEGRKAVGDTALRKAESAFR